ncbi:hypothetical protein ACI79C_22745 [Geodermatophilus sp. SYSU D00697]
MESAQDDSRALARLLFRTSPPAAAVRDAVARVLPLRAALAPIRRLLADPPLA